MRIKIQQFLFGACHSWAVVGQNIGRSLIKSGHDVDFVSTDGFEDKFCPSDLKPFAKNNPSGKYDCQISYTAPHNWPKYLEYGNKNRFAIWNYEYNNKNNKHSLLQGFSKFYKECDWVLPSSFFTREVFLSMGIPDNRMKVIPHGINLSDYLSDNKWPLKTNKSKKILLNIAQPHKRKAIHLALESFGKAFSKNDDVSLIAKIFKKNKKDQIFDVNFDELLNGFKKKFPNHAHIECVYDYIENISDIYKSCDINFSATFAECWHLPSLEALACGLINVVPRYGGQLDFCSDNNSLLIDGAIERCPKGHQYWQHNPYAVHFKINTDDAASKLHKAVMNYDDLKVQFGENMRKTAEKFTWDNAANQILSLCK